MPAGALAGGYTFSIAGNDSLSIGPIHYGQEGFYEYELSQIFGTAPGYTYDEKVYKIEVYVLSDLSVVMIARDKDNLEGEKVKDIVFSNSYGALASDPSLMVDPPVKKTLSGSPATPGVFKFRLTAEYPTQPMPPGSTNGVKEVQIVGSGEEEFGTWSYDQAGVYNYTIHEVNTFEAGYTFDTAIYTITDTVTDVNGQLVLDRVVVSHLNEPVTELAFVNVFSSPTPGPGGPSTGDNLAIWLLVVALFLLGATAISVSVHLNRKR
jgi:pilin isopeptide linkage protein